MKTIVILGGGYAGINLVDSLKKELKDQLGTAVRVILVDKNSYHFRKVLLVKAITEDADDLQLKIPFHRYISKGIEVLQGEVTRINKTGNIVEIEKEDHQAVEVHYDYLVITLGSRVKDNENFIGGMTLKDESSAHDIKDRLIDLINKTKKLNSDHKRQSNLKIALVGAGITGIETACELAVWLKEQALVHGIDPNGVEVLLFDPKTRLLHEAPDHISSRLEKKMNKFGVKFFSNTRVKEFNNGYLVCTDGRKYEIGLCIITNGVEVNPTIKQLQLPLSDQNQLIVNDCYEVEGHKNIYSIGDCARIIDPITNKYDGMTCKEAIPQAQRLAKIIKHKMTKQPNHIVHTSYPVKLFCVSLGPKEGFVWIQKWGMNFTLTGQLGLRFRNYTWNLASLLK
ncbi:FAD-dependent oxidoreductase [Bacillus sp. SM2101]|uniref:NAD(P)/FAD-dependent oxidoreductase n=1 Tax=Bacillus sp. SM2101 TaxID=2805366 RepID=UPI001BDDCC02|nr:FAD-dependent oxidoreductase [Bacillus sp. SM2101]